MIEKQDLESLPGHSWERGSASSMVRGTGGHKEAQNAHYRNHVNPFKSIHFDTVFIK